MDAEVTSRRVLCVHTARAAVPGALPAVFPARLPAGFGPWPTVVPGPPPAGRNVQVVVLPDVSAECFQMPADEGERGG